MIDIKLFVSQLIFQHSQRQTAFLIAKGCCRGTESHTQKYGKEENEFEMMGGSDEPPGA